MGWTWINRFGPCGSPWKMTSFGIQMLIQGLRQGVLIFHITQLLRIYIFSRYLFYLVLVMFKIHQNPPKWDIDQALFDPHLFESLSQFQESPSWIFLWHASNLRVFWLRTFRSLVFCPGVLVFQMLSRE